MGRLRQGRGFEGGKSGGRRTHNELSILGNRLAFATPARLNTKPLATDTQSIRQGLISEKMRRNTSVSTAGRRARWRAGRAARRHSAARTTRWSAWWRHRRCAGRRAPGSARTTRGAETCRRPTWIDRWGGGCHRHAPPVRRSKGRGPTTIWWTASSIRRTASSRRHTRRRWHPRRHASRWRCHSTRRTRHSGRRSH